MGVFHGVVRAAAGALDRWGPIMAFAVLSNILRKVRIGYRHIRRIASRYSGFPLRYVTGASVDQAVSDVGAITADFDGVSCIIFFRIFTHTFDEIDVPHFALEVSQVYCTRV